MQDGVDPRTEEWCTEVRIQGPEKAAMPAVSHGPRSASWGTASGSPSSPPPTCACRLAYHHPSLMLTTTPAHPPPSTHSLLQSQKDIQHLAKGTQVQAIHTPHMPHLRCTHMHLHAHPQASHQNTRAPTPAPAHASAPAPRSGHGPQTPCGWACPRRTRWGGAQGGQRMPGTPGQPRPPTATNLSAAWDSSSMCIGKCMRASMHALTHVVSMQAVDARFTWTAMATATTSPAAGDRSSTCICTCGLTNAVSMQAMRAARAMQHGGMLLLVGCGQRGCEGACSLQSRHALPHCARCRADMRCPIALAVPALVPGLPAGLCRWYRLSWARHCSAAASAQCAAAGGFRASRRQVPRTPGRPAQPTPTSSATCMAAAHAWCASAPHLPGAGIADHVHDLAHGGAAHDGVIHQQHALVCRAGRRSGGMRASEGSWSLCAQ